MKIAIIGSRNLIPSEEQIKEYVSGADEIVSGGARGVDNCAADYAKKHGIKLTVFLPEFEIYGRAAPIVRNEEIVDHADKVIAFWDGKSKGTLSVIKYAEKKGKDIEIVIK